MIPTPILLKEPKLEFGGDLLTDDPKLGISVGGFFSTTSQTHRSELHYAIIGTNNNIEAAKLWLVQFNERIEASDEKVKLKHQSKIEDGQVIDYDDDESLLFSSDFQPESSNIDNDISDETTPDEEATIKNKRLNPDFPGFSKESIFNSSFINDDTNNHTVHSQKIKEILDDQDLTNFDKSVRICDLYIAKYKVLIDTSLSKPSLCFIIIPAEVFKRLSSIPYRNNLHFNLRRYLKAQLIAIAGAIPVQIILEDTILGTKKSLQDLSMQAWNFVVANYYKSGATPWTLTMKDKHTCFIGVSFHKVHNSENNLVRSSIAQAFNFEGKGIVFIGKPFEWDVKKMNTPAPHLTYEYAKNLISQVIEEYKIFNRNILPNRVVIHKTTDFWNSAINSDYAEVEGLKDGIRHVLGEEIIIDLVTIKSSPVKLLRRDGKYPVIRGTMLPLDQQTGVLYTTGYIPYYETFLGVHIPHPLDVSIYEGESTLRNVCDEIMALTKLNFNNCNYYDSLPITIRFAQKVGEIIQYADENAKLPNKYYFYM